MFYQLIISGIGQGSVYALVALGMTLVFRVTTVVNFAHGELFMFSAFVLYAVLASTGVPYLPAALAVLVALFVLGAVVERLLMRPLRHAPHLSLAMMTVALSYLLRGTARFFWGSEVRSLPPLFSMAPIVVGPVVVDMQDFVTVAATFVLVVLFFLALQVSPLGKLARAATDSPRGAALIGVNVPNFHQVMWGSGALVAAVAGVLAAPATMLYPEMGVNVLIHAFAAMTLGGFGSFGGAVVGGLLMGIIEQLAGGYVSTGMVDIASYIVIIAVLLLRPAGLFGRPEVVRV